MSTRHDAGRHQATRLRHAVRPLNDPPCAAAWNAGEFVDMPDAARPKRAAAVLVPFVARESGLQLLFTQRAGTLRQHAGQISFPGGGVDESDVDVVAAALRETDEETGIAAEGIEPFGFLDRLDTVSGYCVTPVAAFLGSNYSIRLHSDEVDEVFEVPLDFILDPSNLQREHVLWRGRERDIFAFHWQQRRIWGVTAAILKNLLDRLEAV